jgi:hypothetical protein
LSDELAARLKFVAVKVDGEGQATRQPSQGGGVLLLIRWPRAPASSRAVATVSVLVDPDAPDGAVIDNLVSVQAANAESVWDAVSIGLPPLTLPDFR